MEVREDFGGEAGGGSRKVYKVEKVENR